MKFFYSLILLLLFCTNIYCQPIPFLKDTYDSAKVLADYRRKVMEDRYTEVQKILTAKYLAGDILSARKDLTDRLDVVYEKVSETDLAAITKAFEESDYIRNALVTNNTNANTARGVSNSKYSDATNIMAPLNTRTYEMSFATGAANIYLRQTNIFELMISIMTDKYNSIDSKLKNYEK